VKSQQGLVGVGGEPKEGEKKKFLGWFLGGGGGGERGGGVGGGWGRGGTTGVGDE